MQVVSVLETRSVAVERGRGVIELRAGERLVMHDVEVAGGQSAGVLELVGRPPGRPARFDPAAGLQGRLIVPFIGGLGEAVSLLPVLGSLRRQFPGLVVDVAATAGPAELFGLSRWVGQVVPYPLALEAWERYDHYLTLEVVHETGQAPGRSLSETFTAALRIELNERSHGLELPRAVHAAAAPSPIPLVGIGVGLEERLRSYPSHLLREVVVRLVEVELGCVLLGHADGSLNVPLCPPIVTDMRSKTPTILELAVWLKAVDVVVAPDGFLMHLAGALGCPTVALFAPTSPALASPYETAAPLASTQACAPCHAGAGRCPRGLERCVAWDAETVAPGAVVDAVRRKLDDGRSWGREWVAAAGG
jgi:ADP-heptose:LPS heptosyltransferase